MGQDTAAPIADKKHFTNFAQQSRQSYLEDQERIDQCLRKRVNEVERSPDGMADHYYGHSRCFKPFHRLPGFTFLTR